MIMERLMGKVCEALGVFLAACWALIGLTVFSMLLINGGSDLSAVMWMKIAWCLAGIPVFLFEVEAIYGAGAERRRGRTVNTR